MEATVLRARRAVRPAGASRPRTPHVVGRRLSRSNAIEATADDEPDPAWRWAALLLCFFLACSGSADKAPPSPADPALRKCKVQWTKVSVSPAAVELHPGESVQLTATVTTNCGVTTTTLLVTAPGEGR